MGNTNGNEMKEVLDDCHLTPDWAKSAIQKCSENRWQWWADGSLNLVVYDETKAKINDEMIDELLRCFAILGDKVKVIDLDKNEISAAGATKLFSSFRKANSNVTEIKLKGNRLDDDCMQPLGEYIKFNKSIKNIDLADNNLTDNGIETIGAYLTSNHTLRSFIISGNRRVTDKSIPNILKFIESSNIENVEVNDTMITRQSMLIAPLAQNIIKHGAEKLNFQRKSVNEYQLSQICEYMKMYKCDKLREINFEGNNLSSKDMGLLFDTLRECNANVSTINASSNNIDDECMKQLGEYIQNNENLEYLSLSGNQLSDNGIKILFEYIVGNTTFQQLDLKDNRGITDESAALFIDIANKSCLGTVDLRNTSITDDKMEEIGSILKFPIENEEDSISIKQNSKSA